MDRPAAIAFAKKYIEDIISFFGVNVRVIVQDNGEIVDFLVPSSEINSLLIGRNAETLKSLQNVVANALQNEGANFHRINIDVADYKKHREEHIAEETKKWIAEVRRTGEPKILDLNPADRRIVHQVAADYEDIYTFSEGEGRDRKITIAQTSS